MFMLVLLQAIVSTFEHDQHQIILSKSWKMLEPRQTVGYGLSAEEASAPPSH